MCGLCNLVLHALFNDKRRWSRERPPQPDERPVLKATRELPFAIHQRGADEAGARVGYRITDLDIVIGSRSCGILSVFAQEGIVGCRELSDALEN